MHEESDLAAYQSINQVSSNNSLQRIGARIKQNSISRVVGGPKMEQVTLFELPTCG